MARRRTAGSTGIVGSRRGRWSCPLAIVALPVVYHHRHTLSATAAEWATLTVPQHDPMVADLACHTGTTSMVNLGWFLR